MGYYTDFTVSIDTEDKAVIEKFFDDLTVQSDYDFSGRSNVRSIGEAKWYTEETDIKLMSIRYPNLLITVDGDGEESGDVWRSKALNGVYRRTRATMLIPEIDMSDVKLI